MYNLTTCIVVFVHLILMISFCIQLSVSVGDNIHKRKLCTEFETSAFKHNEKPIKIFSTLNKNQCLTFCVHERNCSAFNFRLADGACVLLPVSSSPCMSSDTTTGWLYVSLAPCRYQPPWDFRAPEEGPWHWITTNDLTRPDLVVSVSSTNVARYVTRVNLRGMLVPGWSANFSSSSSFFAVDPLDHSMGKCPVGQYLSWSAHADVGPVWKWIDAGDPVPPRAVIGGYGPNMEPLFVARYTQNTMTPAGYYDPRSGKGYFKFIVVNPHRMEILTNSSTV